MWISAFLLRTATEIYPQANVETLDVFHSLCGRIFLLRFIHRKFFHIPQPLWKNKLTIDS